MIFKSWCEQAFWMILNQLGVCNIFLSICKYCNNLDQIHHQIFLHHYLDSTKVFYTRNQLDDNVHLIINIIEPKTMIHNRISFSRTSKTKVNLTFDAWDMLTSFIFHINFKAYWTTPYSFILKRFLDFK